VFCGSSLGARKSYLRAARRTGQAIAERGLGLVYGGAASGLMGELADAALAHGADVVGVLPQALIEREIAHRGLTELRVVDSMHQRKAEMAELADAFMVLPGGLGTLDELFEIWTWAQLELHRKPVGLLDVDGYFEPLAIMIHRMVDEGFVAREQATRVFVDPDPAVMLAHLLGSPEG